MPSATEQLTKVEDQILDRLATLQRPLVDAVKNVVTRAETYVPEVPGSESIPAIDGLIISQFAFAEKLLANQKDFANALLDAIKPLTAKVAAEARPKAKPRTTKAAAA
jgi:hypothetical protein